MASLKKSLDRAAIGTARDVLILGSALLMAWLIMHFGFKKDDAWFDLAGPVPNYAAAIVALDFIAIFIINFFDLEKRSPVTQSKD